jgi:hypothetical protein
LLGGLLASATSRLLLTRNLRGCPTLCGLLALRDALAELARPVVLLTVLLWCLLAVLLLSLLLISLVVHGSVNGVAAATTGGARPG